MKNKDESYLDNLLEEFGKEPPFENDRREVATGGVVDEKMKKTDPDKKIDDVAGFDIEELDESILGDLDLDELDELIHSDRKQRQKEKEGEKNSRKEIQEAMEESLPESIEDVLSDVGVQEIGTSDYSSVDFSDEKQTMEKEEMAIEKAEDSMESQQDETSFVGELNETEIGIEELLSDIREEIETEVEIQKEDVSSQEFSEKEEVTTKETSEQQKPAGFFARLFQKLFSNIPLTKAELEAIPTPEQELESRKEKAEAAKKKKEEKKQNAEAKKKQKAEEAKKKAAEAKAKKKAKEEAKKEAKEKAELNRLRAEAALPPEGKINKAGAMIVILFFLLLGSAVIFGSGLVAYDLKVSAARYKFEKKEYNEAYNRIRGIEIKEKDMDIHNKVYTVMFVNKQLNSYNNYYAMGDYANALDSLVKGLYRYDKYITYATQIGIKSDLNYVRKQIISEFSEIYGMSERDALVLMGIADQQEYSEKVYQIVSGIDKKKIEPKEEIKEYVP